MTHLEAYREFDETKLIAAMHSDLPNRELLDLIVKANREETNLRDLDDAIELWLAGWTSDAGKPPRDVFSWYWRAPPKGKRPLGRKFLSSQQAVNFKRRTKA